MFESKTRNQTNHVHVLNPSGISYAFNTQQRQGQQYAGTIQLRNK
jgi:hypothetical protein